jgi:ketosteroid isomerase-like protein
VDRTSFPTAVHTTAQRPADQYLRTSRSMWADMVSETTPYRRGEQIVVVHHVTGRMRDGTTQDVTVADAYTVQDGLVVRMQAYTDPAQALITGS